MLHKFTLIQSLLFCLLFVNNTQAQDASVKITYEIKSDKSVDFKFEAADPGTYTVIINFKNLTNTLAAERQVCNTTSSSGRLLSLKPEQKDQGIGFSYSYTYIRGRLKPKYDANFTYLLPFKKGARVKVTESAFVNATYFGSTTPDDWKVYRFYTETEDTVTAVRKGVLVSIKDGYDVRPAGTAFTSTVNELIIEQPDGTLATYRGLKKGSFLVKMGQIVYPGTPLGTDSKYTTDGKPNISLLITYLNSDDFENRATTLKNPKSFYGFVTPQFYTAGNPKVTLVAQQEYVTGYSPEIITKEMTKKELKLAGLAK